MQNCRKWKKPAALFTVLAALLVFAQVACAETSLFNYMDALAKGVFNMGPGHGNVKRSFEKAADKDVLRFDYKIPKRSIIGVWTQAFPPELGPDEVDAIKIGVKVANPGQINQVFVKVEIKGRKAVQTIPLRLGNGWNFFREPINWARIGKLREVVFVVSPISDAESTEGVLYFDFDFYKVTPLQKNWIFIKFALVFLSGILAALIFALSGKFFRRRRHLRQLREPDAAGGIKWDLFYGAAAVFIAAVAFAIYSMGTVSPLEAGFGLGFLGVGFAGALIAQLLKYKFTGRNLAPIEVFQNIVIGGLLAASSSRFAVFQAPGSLANVLMLNKVMATIAFLVYHIFNGYTLFRAGRHLKGISGALIAGAPYLFGWLLLVKNVALVGRIFVVFVFNEAVTNGIALAISGRFLKGLKAHIVILLVSLGVVAAPMIADIGSLEAIGVLPVALRAAVAILATMLAFAGLWGEVYLITGMALDFGHRTAPSWETISEHVKTGVRKAMAYSAILLGLLYTLKILLDLSILQMIMSNLPVVIGIAAGILVFPLLKTIIESFDGSLPFFQRARHSYRDWTLYLRGAAAGFGFAYAISSGMVEWAMADRIKFGLAVGLAASAGVSILRDIIYAMRGQGHIQSWRLYITDAALGAFIGSGLAFYLDALQVPVVIEKFKLYTSAGFEAKEYITYPLVSKWGRIDLGSYSGGAKLLFTESLAGVINWSIAAWLFAINKVFLQAALERHTAPIKFFFSKAGLAQLIEHMIFVLRWGLWMSPIIFTFLRMMPEPTWYNQDGAIRTLFAIYHNMTMSPEGFRNWSLNLFVYIMAIDIFRVLIWMDHMGLRVATLVNLSFIGLDRLDERVARFIGPAAAQRYIPEAVKRFATWAPLLIPFYLPRGDDWDYAWSTSEAMQNAAASKGGIVGTFHSLGLPQLLLLLLLAILVCTGFSFAIRSLRRRYRRRNLKTYELANRRYRVVVKENGEIYSSVAHKKRGVFPPEYDISRRSYDIIDPCGRILYLVDTSKWHKSDKRSWPVIGNFPHDRFNASRIGRADGSLKVINTSNGIRAAIDISLPDNDTTAELWEVTLKNLTENVHKLKVVPYLEWVLNGGIHDRFHTQYARLFPEMEYVREANAILSWHRSTKSMGVLAADIPPEGYLTSRMDFIGRARDIWKPRVLKTLDFLVDGRSTAPYPTFDPIGSLLVDAKLEAKASKKFRLLIGYAEDREGALRLIDRHLRPQAAKSLSRPSAKRRPFLIGHGEILPGTPRPYSEYADNGNKLTVHTPYTPRPYDHAMSNAIGHSVMVTNRGLHTSCNGNSQQNRLTPDWPDTVTKTVPSEAIYLYDPDSHEWYSPTHHPLNDELARNESEFSVDGTAVFRMKRATLSTELTVFVPPDEPLGVYLLTLRNDSGHSRRMRIAPYFQMVLEFQPERSGTLERYYDRETGALFFKNPRNIFRTGWAFASMSIPARNVETKRGRFFGAGRGVSHPFMVEKARPDAAGLTDDRQIAAFLGVLDIPAHGESTVAIILGEADERREAERLVSKYKDIAEARGSLENTRRWWLELMGTVEVKTDKPEFDNLQNWLKYQAIAERIWARRGFYQTSGAFGFRDQLQDTVNMIWVDPKLARRQIVLHASQQFLEGDVFHWFFTRTDGRTAFSLRSHASDNPVWLVWAVVEYIGAAGDYSILDEKTSYVFSEFPFADLPQNKAGLGHLYQRSTREDSVYRHALRSIDLVFNKRMGEHGLPLIRTGDWNDGLDDIGSKGRGESVWLGFFLYYALKGMLDIIKRKEGSRRKEHYQRKMRALKSALERTWRGDRYLRAFHDDGTEIGIKDSGIWEIDALTAAWAVMTDINFERGIIGFHTALRILEKDNLVLLGWPALREDSKPYLGRSSKYPEGVRENGMYCHGVQWLIKAARILAERFEEKGDSAKADEYRAISYRLWRKITPVSHTTPKEAEIYGGQPNKQPADILTNFDPGRMIWNGYTGAAGWLYRESMEGIIGASLKDNKLILPGDLNKPRGELKVIRVSRDTARSPLR